MKNKINLIDFLVDNALTPRQASKLIDGHLSLPEHVNIALDMAKEQAKQEVFDDLDKISFFRTTMENWIDYYKIRRKHLDIKK